MNQKIDAPIGAEPAASDRQLQAIRNELDQLRRFRIEQLEGLTADATEAMATADDPRVQVNCVLKLAAELALVEIEGALLRLEQGTYGVCERCAHPVPSERLELLPMTRLCTPCQWVAESGFRSGRGQGWSGRETPGQRAR